MVGGSNRDGQSGLALFAAELTAFRVARGLSQDDLGRRLNYSGSLVAMIECMRRSPLLDFARRCDEVLDTPGTFERLQQNARKTPLPSWFKPWPEIEAQATQLRLFEHSLVPGLLQTEDYARAVLAVQPNTTTEEREELVAARMERQAVLSRTEPPLLWVVLDEAVLRRPVGGTKVMHDQLVHLGALSERPNITVGIIPSGGAHCGLAGAFAVADVDGSAHAVLMETVTDGYIAESAAGIAEVLLTFDSLRSEALPRSASRDLIMKWADDLCTT
jgi:transcriptional regulator with XRE-family HTH domain